MKKLIIGVIVIFLSAGLFFKPSLATGKTKLALTMPKEFSPLRYDPITSAIRRIILDIEVIAARSWMKQKAFKDAKDIWHQENWALFSSFIRLVVDFKIMMPKQGGHRSRIVPVARSCIHLCLLREFSEAGYFKH